MFIKKILTTVVSLFLAVSNLDAAAGGPDPVFHVTSLLTVVDPANYQSSVAVASRAEIMKLDAAQLKQVIAATPAVFNTPYGFSLIHGWMVNQLADKRLPFYVNQHFSFDKYIKNLIATTVGGAVSAAIEGAWKSIRVAIEVNRWAYYEQMQYIPAAIAQAGMIPGAIGGDVIKPAYVQALKPADFDAHIDSIVSGGALAGANEKTRMESIALWAIKRFDVKSLLPANYEINNVEKFKEHVVAGLHVQIPKILQHIGPEQMNLLVGFAAIHQRDPLAGGGLLPTAKNELEQYAVEQPMGDPTAGVPCLVAAVGA